MPVPLTATLTDEAYDDIRWAAREDRHSEMEVISRALYTYFTLRREIRRGRVLGFVDRDHEHHLQTQIRWI
ncbi:hypothetical protein CDN99_19750 [Roseateles aquatilis]|uniref:Ribbon-helix-helix protein CopG domain-containing protein n=1 Tax=Roseateles aquatilis TaxID=431061 RepID=A0A246J2X0_9BURK|nr:hypothetical protein [Roseateles aquatilis]OWQ86938.1 hypothetical protein CDN99_19750 [Roseateles aquatilis]